MIWMEDEDQWDIEEITVPNRPAHGVLLKLLERKREGWINISKQVSRLSEGSTLYIFRRLKNPKY